jgi:hypothetical protein
MKPPLSRWLIILLAAIAGAAVLEAAVVVGTTVYAKRFETNLLTQPQPLAPSSAKVTTGRKLRVDEVRGNWLRVSDAGTSGWVFAGNVSDVKPVEIKGVDGLPIAASKTTATAAGRPLTQAAEDYATRRNIGNARSDLEWLLQQARTVSDDDVQKFLQEQKKGEFQ